MHLPQLDSTDAERVDESAEKVLARIKGTARFLEIAFFVLSGFFAFAVVAFIVLFVAGAVNGAGSSTSGAPEALLAVIGFCFYSAILYVAAWVFRDVAHGGSPFSMKQARRIRLIAWLLLICSLMETLAPMGVSSMGVVEESLAVADHHASLSLSVEIGPLLFAIVFFFLSSVFTYGVKLQELEDDTV